MKVTNLRRKLAATLVAAGLLDPCAVFAADLNVNLVANAGFETVNLNTTSQNDYNSPLILGWSGVQGFAYSHDGSSSSTGVVGNYANGAPLASGGHWYFTANGAGAGPDVTAPGQFFQDIDVSTGATGALIAGGAAAFRLGAFFNSFGDQGDIGHVHARFLNSSNVSLGAADVAYRIPGDLDPFEWTQRFQGGLIPVGTQRVRISAYGVPFSGGPDGYVDNVEFQVTNTVVQPALSLTINRASGGMTLANQTGAPVTLWNYAVFSDVGALDAANWKSIANNYDAGSPGPAQFDPLHNWVIFSEPADNHVLSEQEIAGQGAPLANGRTIDLSAGGAWLQNPDEDLTFQYQSVETPGLITGIVIYTGNGGDPFDPGDFNADGAITAADWAILRNNQLANLSAMSQAEAYQLGDLTGDLANDHADFVAFKTIFDAENGVGAFNAMAANVPEPSSVWLALGAGLFPPPIARRKRQANMIVPPIVE